MTRRLTIAIAVTAICLMLSNAAYAQLADNIELNLFGAGSIYTRNSFEYGYPQFSTPIPGTLSLDNHARFGVRLGVYARGHWGQEFFYSFEPNSVHITRPTAPATDANLHIQVHNYGVNALYYLIETESGVFQPFVSAGIGGSVYRLTPQSVSYVRDPLRGNMRDMDNANELGFNFGIGFKTRTSGRVGFRMDFRDFVGRSPSFGLARQSNDPTATVLPATGAINNGELSVGLVFYFGHR
jgi:opacity protein-like surface antigen